MHNVIVVQYVLEHDQVDSDVYMVYGRSLKHILRCRIHHGQVDSDM